MYNYCKRKSLKLFLNFGPLPLIWNLWLNKLSRLDTQGWFQSITHSIGSGIVNLVIVFMIVFAFYCRLSIRVVNTNQNHLVRTSFFFFFFNKYSKIGRIVRKHLTRGFLCAVLDLSGTLWPLLIPEYSGIKRRGMPFPGLRNPGISHYRDKYPLPSYEKVIVCNSLFNRDRLMFCKSGILIFAENNRLVRQYICPRHVD